MGDKDKKQPKPKKPKPIKLPDPGRIERRGAKPPDHIQHQRRLKKSP